jgi:type IV secretion system protein VirD4
MTALVSLLADLVVGAVTTLISVALHRWSPDRPQSHGSSRWANWRDRNHLGRIRHPKDAAGDGIALGFFGRRLLQSPAEDNVLLLGVQRSGKTSTVVVPTLLTWSGSVVATSTKEELVRLTSRHRGSLGPVSVFAPLDRDISWMAGLGLSAATWNPVAWLTDSGSAAELADHFTAAGKRGSGTHWYLSASNLVGALAVLAKERGADMGFVLTTLNRTAHADYAELSRKVADTPAADLLLAHALTPEREAGSIASTARSCLGLWADERVRRATGVSALELDLDALLARPSTLYLVAPAEEAERCRPLFSALVATLLRKATARARAQGGVLSPRLLLALDEAANFARVPRLAGYASSGPGQGIQLLLCFHDLAQIEAAYGREEMRTVWNNCRARLLLPGQGDLATLEQFSRAIGDETRTYQLRHEDARRSSSSEQRTGRPLASPDDLRRLGNAVLIYASAPPVRLLLRRWDQVPHFCRLAAGGGRSVGSQRRLFPAPSDLVRRFRAKEVASSGWRAHGHQRAPGRGRAPA